MEKTTNTYSLRQLSRILKDENSLQRKHFGPSTDAYRVYDRFFRSFDFTVDVYADYAMVVFYSPCASDFSVDDVVSCVAVSLHIPSSHVIVRSRIKQDSDVEAEQSDDMPSDDFKGERSTLKIQVHENGIAFNVDLLKKLDTGLFIENHRSRLLVKELSKGRNVLNLFCYTGGYTLFAYAGGAAACTSVDTSSTALEACRDNMEANGFASDDFKFVKMDAMEFSQNYAGEPFGLIIIDCPSFSNRHGGRDRTFQVQRDHVALVNACARILSKDGIILFRTSYGAFELDKAKLKGFKIMTYTSEMIPRGFTKNSIVSKTYVLKRKAARPAERVNRKKDSEREKGASENFRARNRQASFRSDAPVRGESEYLKASKYRKPSDDEHPRSSSRKGRSDSFSSRKPDETRRHRASGSFPKREQSDVNEKPGLMRRSPESGRKDYRKDGSYGVKKISSRARTTSDRRK